MPGGRPPIGNEIKAKILERLSAGESLRSICRSEGMPNQSTVIGWAIDNEEFSEQYARARNIGLQVHEDIILAIADDSDGDVVERERADGSTYEFVDSERVARAKLRIDARKWIMSKLRPEKYGDKIVQEHVGSGGKDLAPVVVIYDAQTGKGPKE